MLHKLKEKVRFCIKRRKELVPPNQDIHTDCREVGQIKAGYPLWKKHVCFYLITEPASNMIRTGLLLR